MPRDSHRAFFVEIIFELSQQREVSIDTTRYFQSLTIEEHTDDGGNKGNLTLFDEEHDVLESIVVTGTRKMRFRFDWEENRGRRQTPFFNAEITKYTPTFTPEGVSLSLDFISKGYYEQSIDRNRRPLSWPEGTKVSKIVRDLARKHNWRTKDERGRDTVEEVSNPFQQPIQVGKNQTDMDFIREDLLKRATNKNSEAFRVRLDDETDPPILHFHSDQFLDEGGVKKTFGFAKGDVEDLISFEPSDLEIFSTLLGGRDSKHDSTDSEQGESKTERSDNPDGAGKQRVGPNESEQRNLGDSETKSQHSVVAREVRDLQAQARAKISRAKSSNIKAEAQAMGSRDVRPWDLAAFKYEVQPGNPHFLSGIYRVLGVTHELGSDSWTVTYSLQRKGTLPTGESGEDVRGKRVERTQRENLGAGLEFISKSVQ